MFPIPSNLSQHFWSLNYTTESENITEVYIWIQMCLDWPERPTGSLMQEGIITRIVLRHERDPREDLKCGYSNPMISGICHSLGSNSCNKNKTRLLPTCQILAIGRLSSQGGTGWCGPSLSTLHHIHFMDKELGALSPSVGKPGPDFRTSTKTKKTSIFN